MADCPCASACAEPAALRSSSTRARPRPTSPAPRRRCRPRRCPGTRRAFVDDLVERGLATDTDADPVAGEPRRSPGVLARRARPRAPRSSRPTPRARRTGGSRRDAGRHGRARRRRRPGARAGIDGPDRRLLSPRAPRAAANRASSDWSTRSRPAASSSWSSTTSWRRLRAASGTPSATAIRSYLVAQLDRRRAGTCRPRGHRRRAAAGLRRRRCGSSPRPAGRMAPRVSGIVARERAAGIDQAVWPRPAARGDRAGATRGRRPTSPACGRRAGSWSGTGHRARAITFLNAARRRPGAAAVRRRPRPGQAGPDDPWRCGSPSEASTRWSRTRPTRS